MREYFFRIQQRLENNLKKTMQNDSKSHNSDALDHLEHEELAKSQRLNCILAALEEIEKSKRGTFFPFIFPEQTEMRIKFIECPKNIERLREHIFAKSGILIIMDEEIKEMYAKYFNLERSISPMIEDKTFQNQEPLTHTEVSFVKKTTKNRIVGYKFS